MLKVYVAGPYSANNVLDVLRNIGRGEKTCATLFHLGYAPFCPWHDKSYVMDLSHIKLTVDQFREHSIAWLKVSDAMFVHRFDSNSVGLRAEIKIAKECGIPVFYNLTDLREYRKNRIVPS